MERTCKARRDSRFCTEWCRNKTLFTRRNRVDAEGSLRARRQLLWQPQAFTGLRLGELRGLTWDSYEPTQNEDSLGWLNVTRSVWRNTIGDPKTANSKAPVPVIPQLAKRLDVHPKSCKNSMAGPIFANSAGHPLDLNACYQREMKDDHHLRGT
jgi:integrase